MFNNSGIKKETYADKSSILFATEYQVSLGVVVDDSVAGAAVNGKKIVKAGTPLTGSLDARTTPFTAAATSGSPSASNAVGILLHDVDVTDGDNNGDLLIFGFVDTNKIDTATLAKITAEAKAAMPGIRFVKC